MDRLMRNAVMAPTAPRKDPPPKDAPRKDPPTEEPPHKDPPPAEPPRRDPEPEVPVVDPPAKDQPPTLPPPPSEVRNRARLHEILAAAGTAMLLTRGADGTLRHRPVTVARFDGEALYVATTLDGSQLIELTADPRVDVIIVGEGHHAALAGIAEISRDRALIDRLWDVSWASWFPAGARARDLAVLIVHPLAGEYWDGCGMKGVAVQYRAA
jgi:general stress protein 26